MIKTKQKLSDIESNLNVKIKEITKIKAGAKAKQLEMSLPDYISYLIEINCKDIHI